MFVYFIFSFLLLSSQAHGRPVEVKCSKAPLTKKEVSELKQSVRESEFYKNLLLLKASQTHISVSRCNQTNGNVSLSYILFEDILGKKCSINSMFFRFNVVANNIEFEKYTQRISRSVLKESLEKIGQSPKTKKFFQKNNFCQIEFNNSSKPFHWVLQLRDEKKNFCFIRSSYDGSEVKIIERLYAKNSNCS